MKIYIFSLCLIIVTLLTGVTITGCSQGVSIPRSNLQTPSDFQPGTPLHPPISPTLTKKPEETMPASDEAIQLRSGLNRIASPDVDEESLSTLVNGNTRFVFDFFQAVRGNDGNIFFSPYSLSLALAMTYTGARGETENQMKETLHFDLPQAQLHTAFNSLDQTLVAQEDAVDNDNEAGFQLNIANSIWGQRSHPFKNDFLDILAENYGAGLRLTDFMGAPEPARLVINDWVSNETEEKIQDLIPSGGITPDTRLVLANAIYFKARWLHPFQPDLTLDRPFTTLDGEQVMVPMMSHSQPILVPYVIGASYQAVELPYQGNAFSMLIIVPDEGTFRSIESKLDSELLDEIIKQLTLKNVALTLPTFSFDSTYGLTNTFAGMGMPDAFTPQEADFSGMDGSHNLFLSNIFHKAFVAVDEEGTEAAAATAVIVGVTSLPIIDVTLTIDRPFIFLIRHIDTGSILFMGRVHHPQP
jgi:serpin B